jgi:hypothetical protein
MDSIRVIFEIVPVVSIDIDRPDKTFIPQIEAKLFTVSPPSSRKTDYHRHLQEADSLARIWGNSQRFVSLKYVHTLQF